jgi:NhaA family Na+:H+ antiporter
MTIFFLLIGLELEREIYQGELSNQRHHSSVMAAIGAWLFPLSSICRLMQVLRRNPAPVFQWPPICICHRHIIFIGKTVTHFLKNIFNSSCRYDDLGAILSLQSFTQKVLF